MQSSRQFLTIRGHRLDVTGLSARNRRNLAVGIRGADTDLLEELDLLLERVTPELLAEMTDEDLATLRADLEARRVAAVESAPEKPDTGWTQAELDALKGIEATKGQIDGALAAIDTDTTRREEAAEALAGEAQALLDAIRGEGGDPEGGDGQEGAEGEEGAGEGEGAEGGEGTEEGGEGTAGEGTEGAATEGAESERIAAAARPPRRVEARGRATTPVPTRTPKMDERLVLRASANVPGATAGQILDTPAAVANAFQQVIRATAGFNPGVGHNIPVVRLGVDDAREIYGEDRTLDDYPKGNQRKIRAHSDLAVMRENVEAERAKGDRADKKLAASQGFCAPTPVNYDQTVIGSTARPVRDEMGHRYGADRGGVSTIPSPRLAEVHAAGPTTVWTAANDVALNSPATKHVAVTSCPDPVETTVDAIVTALKVGNFKKMNFQENIDAWIRLAAVDAARVAETKMLTKIGANSVQVAVAATGNELGTARNILGAIARKIAQERSFNRLDDSFPYRLGFPAWLRQNMYTDLMREVPGATAERLAYSQTELANFIEALGVNLTWFLDGETGQVYAQQTDGAMLGWASHVIGYLYPEGQWLSLDGGSLDFGIYRDHGLNSTNDFEMMSEFFENMHQNVIGESMRLDIDICPSGKTSLPVAIDPCVAGS